MTLPPSALARRIRFSRQECGMTKTEAAKSLGVPPPDYDQIETGRRPLSTLELKRLAYLFGRAPRDFVGGKFPRKDILTNLYIAHAPFCSPDVREDVRQCVSLGREAMELERLTVGERTESYVASHLAKALKTGRPDITTASRDVRLYLLSLAISAYRRGALSLGRVRELGATAGYSVEALDRILAVAGLSDSGESTLASASKGVQ